MKRFLIFLLLFFPCFSNSYSTLIENAENKNTITQTTHENLPNTTTIDGQLNNMIENENNDVTLSTSQSVDYTLYRISEDNVHFFNYSIQNKNFNIKIKLESNNKFSLFVKGIFEEDSVFSNSYIKVILKNGNDLKQFKKSMSILLSIKESIAIDSQTNSIIINKFSIETLLKVLFLAINNTQIIDIAISRN